MTQEWYYTTDGQTHLGPVSTDELKRLARSGKLAPTDMVQMAGVPKWVPAAKVKGLFDGAVPPAVVEPDPGVPSADDLPSSPVRTTTTRTPGQRATALLGQLKEKYRANPRRVSLLTGGVGLVVMIGCCGGVGLLGLLTGKGDTELTAAYYPHRPGLDRAVIRKVYSPLNPDTPPIETRWRMVHKPDGTIETIGPPPFNATETVKYRQADGCVELGLRDGTWEPVLKLKAKPGEGWERNGRSYTFKEFTKYNGAQCAVVLEKSVYQGLKKETLNWYAKGDGLVKQEDRVESDGQMKLLFVMTVEGVGSEESKSKYDWGAKPPESEKADAQKPEEGGGGGRKGGKVYTVKVEGRTVRVELSEGMAEEIDLSDLVYNKKDWQIDLKVKRLAPIARRYTKWQYTLLDKGGVSLASSELIHPSLSVGQTGVSALYLGPTNKDKVVKITLP